MKLSLSETFLSVALATAVFVFLLGLHLMALMTFSDVTIARSDPLWLTNHQAAYSKVETERESPHVPDLSHAMPSIPEFNLKRSSPAAVMPSLRGQRPSQRPFTPADLEKRFPILPNFTFPQPGAVQPVPVVARALWVDELRLHLSQLQDTQITMVTSNYAYTDVLLNWLIAATVRSKIPLSSILVISMSSNLNHFLRNKHIPSIFLPPESLLNPNFNFTREFDRVMMVRLSVMRLINHFGFDVANYDTDAIILKDPQPLYDKLLEDQVIGSVGWIPTDLYQEWGVTICIGLVLLRSSRKTEEYWYATSRHYEDCYDDQLKLNYGLKALDIYWSNNGSNYNTTTIYGRAVNGLRVSILPLNLVCRLEACTLQKRRQLYIWHKGGHRTRKEKIDHAREGQTWFLRYQWNLMKETYQLTGVEWLSSIAYYMATHS